MKKIKLLIIVLFLCAICSIGAYIYAESTLVSSNNIFYNNATGLESTNVQDAIDEVHSLINSSTPSTPSEKTLLWTNSNDAKAFSKQTIDLDLSNYKGVAISFITIISSNGTKKSTTVYSDVGRDGKII